MAAEHPGALRLHLAKDLPALPERVFAAFVEADQLRQWWGPAGFAVSHLRFNVAEGATFRITMQPPEGDVFHLGGTFRVVEAPTRLVFTFAWEESDPDDQETVVALTFAAAGSGTRLVLDQRPFKTKPRWELHRDGWTDTFAQQMRTRANVQVRGSPRAPGGFANRWPVGVRAMSSSGATKSAWLLKQLELLRHSDRTRAGETAC